MSRIKLFIVFIALSIFAFGVSIDTKKAGDMDVVITSSKSLAVGTNNISIKLVKNGKAVKNAKVKMKVFMPSMPGMPYMDSKSKAKLDGDSYKTDMEFTMSGTWQYRIKIKTDDGKKYKIKGSVNL
jgi:hypothetical protein